MFKNAMYVCLCHAVTESDLADAIAGGADSLAALQASTGAGTGCGSCLGELELWAARARGRRLPVIAGAAHLEATPIEARPMDEERTAA